MTDLETLGGSNSQANGINNRGQVVNSSYINGDNITVGFIYLDGHMIDLNSFINANSGWAITGASRINDNGQILGTGTFNGNARAILMTPME